MNIWSIKLNAVIWLKESTKSSFHVTQKDSETDNHADRSISEAEPDSFKCEHIFSSHWLTETEFFWLCNVNSFN